MQPSLRARFVRVHLKPVSNTRGKPDTNIPMDQEMEHRIRHCKMFLGRLGANFQPKIAQAYTRSLDALAGVVEDVEETLKCAIRTTHTRNQIGMLISVARPGFGEEGVFQIMPWRESNTGNEFQSLFQVANDDELLEWCHRTVRKLHTGTTFSTDEEKREHIQQEDEYEEEGEGEGEGIHFQDEDGEVREPDEPYLFATDSAENLEIGSEAL